MNTLSIPRRILKLLHAFGTRGIHFLYTACIKPKSPTEDGRRRELILNIILCGSIALIAIFDSILLASVLSKGAAYRGVSFVVFTSILGFFVVLLGLSRNGYFEAASYLLIGAYYLVITYAMFHWSYLLPPVFLSYTMIIVAASILLGTRAGFIVTALIMGTIMLIGHFQQTGTLPVQLYWMTEPITVKAAFEDGLILLLIMTISWLSNREIESSLIRARKSEAAVIEERDKLEQTVEERTRELKKIQEDQIAQLKRFAEFGKLSSGMFHDLMNPLSAVIGNVSLLETDSNKMPHMKECLEKAVTASKRMGVYLETIRKQLKEPTTTERFSLNKEVREAVDILQYHARTSGVTLVLDEKETLFLEGKPLAIHQVALNLISNAIDSYADELHDKHHVVTITIERAGTSAVLRVADQGCGIAFDMQQKIFEPFFTTKSHTGIGLGLSSVKDIVAAHGGMITLESTLHKGTKIDITLPLFI